MKIIYKAITTLVLSYILSANIFFVTAMEETEAAVNIIKRKELGNVPEDLKEACSVFHLEEKIAPVASHLLFLKQVVGEALDHLKKDYYTDYNQKREELFPGWDNEELTDFLFWAYNPIVCGIDNSHFTDKRPESFKEKLNEINEDPLKKQALRNLFTSFESLQKKMDIPAKKVNELEKLYRIINEAFCFYNNLATITHNLLVDFHEDFQWWSFIPRDRTPPRFTIKGLLKISSKQSCKYLLSSIDVRLGESVEERAEAAEARFL